MTKTATATHRVFDALQGLYPVTFANVREADPEGLLDIFEGNDGTRDAYFADVTSSLNDNFTHAENAQRAGQQWAVSLEGFGTGYHKDECENNSRAYRECTDCDCRDQQYASNQQWGTELYEAIQQRIDELNG